MTKPQLMRDVLLENVGALMRAHDDIFFLTDDMGAPALDSIFEEMPERIINVGIAEQNLIGVATGLAIEGYTVFTYGIAGFYLRAYEQIRINLALTHQTNALNVNLIGVGSGVSYDSSGPTHHCLEDVSVMRVLPGIEVLSATDLTFASALADYCANNKHPKYLRLDGKKVDQLYAPDTKFNWKLGFNVLRPPTQGCLVSTGIMTHKAAELAQALEREGLAIGVIDIFSLTHLQEDRLRDSLTDCRYVWSLEEGFLNAGGLDALMRVVLNGTQTKFRAFGFQKTYTFLYGDREILHEANGCGRGTILDHVRAALV